MNWNAREGCPEEHVLKLSIREGYSPSDELIAHIETCANCQGRLETLTSDVSLAETRDQWQQHTIAQNVLSAPLRPNDLGSIEQFAIESVIGAGGMGIVYRGWDTLLSRAVGIKIVRPDQSSRANERLRRECQALAQIQNDHIVPIYSTGPLSNGLSYLVMPLMTGGSLAELLAERPLSARESAEIIHAVAGGLAAAHAAGLIHRDVKPANILFEEPGGRPRLTDFGLVRTEHAAGLTQTDMLCGTPEYMSPEQAYQPDRIDARSDIYSLGITLYECLTGVPPYRGRPLDILNQHRLGDGVAPSRLNGQIPRDLESICLKAIATSPEDRYPTATAFADDLLCYLESRPVQAKPANAWKRTRLWCHRNRNLAFSLATIFIVLLTGIFVSLTFWLRSEANAREARNLNSKLIASNDELLANRQRLRTSVSRFQKSVFSDESLHWQMSREFRAAMFQDVIGFLDEFATYDTIDLNSNEPDPLAEDYLDVARAAAHVRQNEEGRVAAVRVIARLQPLVEAKENRSLGNWMMLNESTRILMRIQSDASRDEEQGKSSTIDKDDKPEWKELEQLSLVSAARALQLAPNNANAQLNDLATQYARLVASQAKKRESERSFKVVEELLTKVLRLAEQFQEAEHASMSSAVTLAAEMGWMIVDENPEAAEGWLPLIERQIVRCREVLRAKELSITAMEMLRGGNYYHHGLALVSKSQHAEAAKLFGQAIPIFHRAVTLQPQNRRAVLEYAQAAEAATRCFMQVDDYKQAQQTLDPVLSMVSKSMQTDPTDNELRKSLIGWFCLYGDVSRRIEDYDWATRGYATAAGDCKLFVNPSPELLQWSYETRKYALTALLEIIDKSPMASKRAMYEQLLEQWESEFAQGSSATTPKR